LGVKPRDIIDCNKAFRPYKFIVYIFIKININKYSLKFYEKTVVGLSSFTSSNSLLLLSVYKT